MKSILSTSGTPRRHRRSVPIRDECPNSAKLPVCERKNNVPLTERLEIICYALLKTSSP